MIQPLIISGCQGQVKCRRLAELGQDHQEDNTKVGGKVVGIFCGQKETIDSNRYFSRAPIFSTTVGSPKEIILVTFDIIAVYNGGRDLRPLAAVLPGVIALHVGVITGILGSS